VRWRRVGHSVTTLGRDAGEASAADVRLVAVPSVAIADALRRCRGSATPESTRST
jgi:8-hydroxy-5-deazaflavin:NADPH oxidoreductase